MNGRILQNLLKSVFESILILFTHQSSLKYAFHRAVLRFYISKKKQNILRNMSALINSVQINLHHVLLVPVPPPTSFTPPPLSKEQIPPVWATPLRLLWNRLPLWQKGKEKEVYPAQSMSFAPVYSSIYPSDFQMRSWHLQTLDATTMLQTMQKQTGKTDNHSQTSHDKLSPEKVYHLSSSFSDYPIYEEGDYFDKPPGSAQPFVSWHSTAVSAFCWPVPKVEFRRGYHTPNALVKWDMSNWAVLMW